MAGPLERDTCRDYVLPQLRAAGWADDQIVEQYRITDGRVITVGRRHRRGDALRADYVLEYRPGLPIAVVEAKREYAAPGKGMQQAKRYAQLLEDDAVPGVLAPFNRLLQNADGSTKESRYYQRVAINRAVEAILRGDKRLLLTLATGTGKTFVAMQIAWKLWGEAWRPDRNPRVLYLADRNVLVDQPKDREFTQAFGEGPLHKLQGEAKAGREIYFALYQALADSGADPNGMFREFAPDFFDLVIVDECHRGSAGHESSWRKILDHFSPATQLGMTATPKRDDRFGREIPDGLYTTRQFERVVSLLARTDAAARHLSDYLRRTDRWAKTIVFCVDQEHADQMRRALHNANSDLTTQHPNYAVRIVGDEGDLGRAHLSDFGDTEKDVPVVATTSQMLSTGVDLPTVRNIVLFAPVGSIALFKQMIGRGTSSTTPAPRPSSAIRSSTARRNASTRNGSTTTAPSSTTRTPRSPNPSPDSTRTDPAVPARTRVMRIPTTSNLGRSSTWRTSRCG